MRLILRGMLALCLVSSPALAAAADIAIVGAKVYPAPDAAPVPDAVVLIHAGRIAAELRPAILPAVEHVAAGIELEADRLAEGGHLIDDQPAREIGAGQIVHAVGDDHPHLRIGRDRAAQIGDRRVAIVAHPIIVHRIGEQVVARLQLPPDLVGDEIDHRAGGRRDDRVEDRIARFVVGRSGEGIEGGDVRIIDRSDLALAPMDLAQIGGDRHPSLAAADERGIEPGERGNLGGQPIDRGRIRSAAEQIGREFAAVIGLDIGQRLGPGQLALALEPGGGHRRQGHHIGQGRQRILVIVDRLRIEIGRDHRDAVEADPELALEIISQPRHAIAAIAFADQELGAGQPPGLVEPVEHHPAQIFDIGLRGVEIALGAGIVLQAAREAGPDRIDEHQIGEIEPAIGIVARHRGIGRRIALRPELDALGPDRAEIEEGRGGTRAAVEAERHRAAAGGMAGHGVGGEDDLPDLLALGIPHRNRADGDIIGDRLAGDHRALADRLVGGERRQGDIGGGFLFRRIGIGGDGGRGQEQRERQSETHRKFPFRISHYAHHVRHDRRQQDRNGHYRRRV